MKKYLITACLFVMGFIVFASEIIEIPFYYDKADGHIYVYAEIGNKKGFLSLIPDLLFLLFLTKRRTIKVLSW